MRTYPQAPPLPGAGNPRNLIPSKDGLEACPCCGAVWKGGRPWSEAILNPAQMSVATGLTPQAITQRIRNGTIAAYLSTGNGARNGYLIPVFEVNRVLNQDPLDGGANKGTAAKSEDLGVRRG